MARLALAGVGLLVALTMTGAAVTRPALIDWVLAAYLASTFALIVATWDDWWLDVQATRYEVVIDLVVGAVIVFGTGGFASTFFVFGNVYIICALIRWGWRESLIVAVGFLAIFTAASLLNMATGGHFEPDPARLVARVGNLVILVLLAMWVGSHRSRPPVLPEPIRSGDRALDASERTVVEVRQLLGATDVAVIWAVDGVEAFIRRNRDPVTTVTNPRVIEAIVACGRPQLFAVASGRAAVRSDAAFGIGVLRRSITCHDAIEQVGIAEGMAIPFGCDEASGIVVAAGIPGMCVDDLDIADDIAARACDAICGAEVNRHAAHAVVTAANLETACNVHDTVIQSLSGTAFRLQALKAWIASGKDPVGEIDRLLSDVRVEQARARELVGRLRQPSQAAGEADIRAVVRKAAEQAARTWRIACPVGGGSTAIFASAWLAADIGMLVSEAIANAVRHGGATETVVTLTAADGWLSLGIQDNGRGFARDAAGRIASVTPWTLNERVQRLGGHITMRSHEFTHIDMTIPIGFAA